MKNPALILVGLAGIVLLMSRKALAAAINPSWTPERLARSATAAKLGIDNTIPPELRHRARALGWCAEEMERFGVRVTSGYRSPVLNWALYHPAKAAAGERGTREGDHTQCLALDGGAEPGQDSAARLVEEERRARASRVGPGIERAIHEGDHVHFRLRATWLDALADRLARGENVS